MMSVHLLGLATALPPHKLSQADAHAVARRVWGAENPQFERLMGSFESSGVKTRYCVVPPDWFETPQNWLSRTQAYLQGAGALFVDAARKAIADAGCKPDEIDMVITVSSTGIATPTLDAREIQAIGFKDTISRIPIFGIGCAGGVTGLQIARQLAQGAPGSKVLLVCVETSSLVFRTQNPGKADLISATLFGDGAAAAVVSTDGEGPILGPGHQILWPDSLHVMGWEVEDTGLGVILDRSVPRLVEENFADATLNALKNMSLDMNDIDRFICHPGGAKVISAIETALHLPNQALDHERAVLRDFGNMSASTVLFILRRFLDTRPKGQFLMTAMGPGFTSSFLSVTS